MIARSQRRHIRPSRAALAAGVALSAIALGCGMELPLAERIAFTRPLATRVEVLEPTKPPEEATRAEGTPLETLRVVSLFGDTDGALTPEEIETEIEPIWIACNMQPLVGLFGCISAEFPTTLADIPDCVPTDISALDPMAESFPLPPSPCRMVDGTPGQPEMQIPLDLGFLLGGDLEITMFGHRPGQGDTEACARAILEQEDSVDESCIVTTMRAPIGPDGQLTMLAQMFGLDESLQLGPVPDPIPDPDDNPRIATFSIAVIGPDDEVRLATDVATGDVVQAELGDRIEIVTESSEDDLQTYVIPKDGTDFEERTEVYTGAWFRTWGELLSPSSDDPRSTNTWTMVAGPQDEGEIPPDGRATMYYVLRDDRQGVAWTWFTVEITG